MHRNVEPGTWNWRAVSVTFAPILAAILWLAMLLATAATGGHPLWGAPPRSLAEAAARRDAGAVVRFIEAGERMSRAEALAASRDADIVQLILDEGGVR